MLLDTLGLVHGALAHPADIQGRASAPWLLRLHQSTVPRLELIWADSACLGQATNLGLGEVWLAPTGCRTTVWTRGWMRADQAPPTRLPDFQPAPHRWIVGRTFAWIGRNRRMSRDDEFLAASSEAGIYLSMIRLMLKCLAHERVHPAFHYRQAA